MFAPPSIKGKMSFHAAACPVLGDDPTSAHTESDLLPYSDGSYVADDTTISGGHFFTSCTILQMAKRSL